ncbi:MAG: alanine--glyoxylate aminotransferase family protein [Dehalococcoidales bacterium]|jgi:aspartate aminotransferase-like enzyme|nr:alanine--glyoxylate aminotransferase family protein [Dehalococcoidales bacterium]MDP6737802.1 alanine--glyoxylate aminotransferase family protein [Dehalococcoidales bacterium]
MVELRIPGPTPCPPEVLQAMARQMVNHRGSDFVKLMNGVTDKLKQVFMTRNDVFVLTGSGTGGMEAAIVNTLSPGDKVLAVSIGSFGDRFANIARAFGADVIPMNVEWGKAADSDTIRQALRAEPQIKAVLVTHNETSTGVTNDLAAISSVVKNFDKLLLVDSVSGMGSIKCPVDEWHLDVVISGSQKGWMVPPGLVFASVSPEAWKAHANSKMPRSYWDFTKAKRFLEKGQTPWTPAVSLIFAMDVALDMMLKEGLPNLFGRHIRVAEAARSGIKSLGLSLFADERHASDTVTAVTVPEELDVKQLRQILREEYKVVLAGGQGKLEEKIFRIGHLGWVNEDNIRTVISALKVALPQAGAAKVT